MNRDDWRQLVRKKLTEIYGKDVEKMQNFITLLAFFNKETEKDLKDSTYLSPFTQTLKMALELDNDIVFKGYASRMMNDAVEFLKRPSFYNEMQKIYSQFTKPNCSGGEEDTFLIIKNLDEDSFNKSGTLGLFSGLRGLTGGMTATQQRELINALGIFVKTYAVDYRAVACVDDVVSVFNKVGGNVMLYGLVSVYLTYECWINLRRWWKGEISGKRCGKNCIDSLSQVAAGIGGGLGGAAIGSFIGTSISPGIGTGVGYVVGGIFGGLLGGSAAKVLSDAVTRRIFDLPKDEALENAFTFLQCHHGASNNELNKSFHRLCLKFHPDKGGDKKDFHLLQFHMATIKLSRGEQI